MGVGVERTTLSGTVTFGGWPMEGAYVQLLDAAGFFTAERRTGPDGGFRFYLRPGRWGLVVMAPGGLRDERVLDLEPGEEAVVDVSLGG
jgi:hypothetical protein